MDSTHTTNDALEHPTESPISEIHTTDIEMTGAFLGSVVSSDRSESHVPEKSANRSPQATHQQPRSQVPIYDSRLQAELSEVKQKFVSLAAIIAPSALAQDPSSSLHAHYGNVLKASNFEFPETRTVGFIGDSGVGECLQVVDHPILILFWPS